MFRLRDLEQRLIPAVSFWFSAQVLSVELSFPPKTLGGFWPTFYLNPSGLGEKTKITNSLDTPSFPFVIGITTN
jgi:hypothetical protein